RTKWQLLAPAHLPSRKPIGMPVAVAIRVEWYLTMPVYKGPMTQEMILLSGETLRQGSCGGWKDLIFLTLITLLFRVPAVVRSISSIIRCWPIPTFIREPFRPNLETQLPGYLISGSAQEITSITKVAFSLVLWEPSYLPKVR